MSIFQEWELQDQAQKSAYEDEMLLQQIEC